MSETKVRPEFFSEWHQDAHISGMKAELAAAELRVAELEPLVTADDPVMKQALERVENAHKELQRLGAEKKPAAKKK